MLIFPSPDDAYSSPGYIPLDLIGKFNHFKIRDKKNKIMILRK